MESRRIEPVGQVFHIAAVSRLVNVVADMTVDMICSNVARELSNL